MLVSPNTSGYGTDIFSDESLVEDNIMSVKMLNDYSVQCFIDFVQEKKKLFQERGIFFRLPKCISKDLFIRLANG